MCNIYKNIIWTRKYTPPQYKRDITLYDYTAMKLKINIKTLKLKELSTLWVKKKIQTETIKYVQMRILKILHLRINEIPKAVLTEKF